MEERTFAKYNHKTAVMGIAAVAQYKLIGDITANSVVVTKILQGGTVQTGHSN